MKINKKIKENEEKHESIGTHKEKLGDDS